MYQESILLDILANSSDQGVSLALWQGDHELQESIEQPAR